MILPFLRPKFLDSQYPIHIADTVQGRRIVLRLYDGQDVILFRFQANARDVWL
jgi:hypothetical protein